MYLLLKNSIQVKIKNKIKSKYSMANVIFKLWKKLIKILEAPGIDPGTSHMLSERSTIWATPPVDINIEFNFFEWPTWSI